MLGANFCIHVSECPVITLNHLKSIYNSSSKDTYLHPIYTSFPTIASNEFQFWPFYTRIK